MIDGTHRKARHGDESAAKQSVDAAAKTFGKLTRPKHLKRDALVAWKRYIEPAAWLDVSREPLALAFCELWQEFVDGPKVFAAAKHGQLRHYMAELGLTDERNRVEKEREDRDEFFDD